MKGSGVAVRWDSFEGLTVILFMAIRTWPLSGLPVFRFSTVLSQVCMYFFVLSVCMGVVFSVCLLCLGLCTNNACFVEVMVSSREAVTSWASRVTLCYHTYTHSCMHADVHIIYRELHSTFLAPEGPTGQFFSLCSTPLTGLKSREMCLNGCFCVCVCVC